MVRGSVFDLVLHAVLLKASDPLTYILRVVPSKLAARWVQEFQWEFITLSW